MKRLLLFVVLLVAASPFEASAQATLPPVPHDQLISTNPFGMMFEWFNAEYERRLSDATTVSLTASRMKAGDLKRGTAALRYYPQGAALSGIYLGGRFGYIDTAPADDMDGWVAGFEIGRTWLFGSNQNISFSVGAGLDRFLSGSRNAPPVVPSLRLFNVGFAF